jgi:DNA (cytosine-5)-methyltransferase 1
MCFREIMAALRGLGDYNVYWEKLNASSFGIPQNRPRIFIVGVLSYYDTGFSFPKPIRCCNICGFLDRSRHSVRSKHLPTSAGSRKNVLDALAAIRRSGGDPFIDTYFVDCDSVPERAHIKHGASLCLTHSRARGHWITSRGRYMTVKEMMRLQGFPESYKMPASDHQCGQLLGNSMCVDVLVHLLARLLDCTQLLA